VLAIRSGAVTVVETPMTSQQLAAEIQEALRISEKRWEHILAVRDARSRVATLTSREHDTLPGVLRGRTNDAVASDLSVSTRTIERRRRSILERLGVDCFAEVVHLLDTAGQPVFPFLEGRQAGDTQSRPAQEKSPEGHLQRRGSSFDPNLFHWHTGRQARQCPVFPPVQNRW